MIFKSELYNEIEEEFAKVSAREYLKVANPLSNLKTTLYYLKKHHFTSKEELEKLIVKEISETIKILESDIITKAMAFQELAYNSYQQLVDPQKWINFSQREATILSFDEYPEKELKLLRHLHILWLTWIYCDEELRKLRIRSSKDNYINLGKAQRDYIVKRNNMLKERIVQRQTYDED
ncbi:hypothetical protein SSABA_v1c05660 [Spiroplasma sabaudiense Ar-1343]|uniref:Uncharacterized protein n=1 Tax=Spiroplasma sabaudiense Ar-1343 TaxID=1276257 RepID=W6AAU0_9MOLU|nr:hypothetical protein [Spiroplasma sabaudiense]AHI53970.1 hypothetical protein SSABA_v1c05660 [Spiroplasma sabaudiense Ar-1343]